MLGVDRINPNLKGIGGTKMFASFRVIKLTVALGVLGLGVTGISGLANAADSIAGTPHDLRIIGNGGANRTGTDDTNTDMCIYCHTPHMRASADAVAPLWNRAITSSTGFTMYDSTTIDMTIAGEPQGVSLACLSCHDGVTGLDSAVQESGRQGSGVLSPTDANVPNIMTGRHALGTDLSNQHPISVTYDDAADTSFNPQATAETAGLVFYGATGDQVECGSCHNPHDAVTVLNRFLRISNDGSQLCLACHIK